MTNSKYIDDYINFVRNGDYAVCKYQLQLCDLIEKIFESEDIRVDEEQLEKYLDLQKYFPFKLLPWEIFCFALHNCVYKADGQLRFPILFMLLGRGSGKNGFLSFEDFALLTPVNNVKEYDIDVFATSEEQAKQSFFEVYNVLEEHKNKMKKHFYWTKEVIQNLHTRSKFRFNTANPKTKDGARPGKVDHDEIHQYEDYRLFTVSITGLGKKPLPRRTMATTDGDVRGGVLDDIKEKSFQILSGEIADNGTLPFICCLDSPDEVNNPDMWHKANPSLYAFPALMAEMLIEYNDYIINPAANTAFMTKRMNVPPTITENSITAWENIVATEQDINEEDLINQPCTVGFDYMTTTDFLGAGLLYRVNGKDVWITHSWVCTKSKDLSRIKAPLKEWEARGLLTFVDAVEIPPELPVTWVKLEAEKRNSRILNVGIDYYRHALMQRAINEILFPFLSEKDLKNYVTTVRPRDEMRVLPIIVSDFQNQRYVWGNNPLMRWYANNSKVETVGINMIIGKIEPKSRKTDGFKAFVAAKIVSDCLDNAEIDEPVIIDATYTY